MHQQASYDQIKNRILLVEDDAELRELFHELLVNASHRVSCVANGKEALEYLRRNPAPDLILLDLMMPVMDGWQFRIEQKRDPALAYTPVIALSADGSPKAAAVDAELYLQKPVDSNLLLESVARVIQESRERRVAQAERM